MTRVICISGDAVSGKSTAARLLLERLPGWRIASTGESFRALCAERGLDPQSISDLDEEIHRAADDRMRARLRTEARLIAEARLVGYLAADLPDALRVFCVCPLEIRAARYREREPAWSAAEALRRVAERDRKDTENFLRFYGIDYHDPCYYHLQVDTGRLGPQEVAETILEAARAG
jgi:predicted cytidylate kinase